MGPGPAAYGAGDLTTYVLDSTVIIGYLRDTPGLAALLGGLVEKGHTLALTGVNLAEVEARSAYGRAAAHRGVPQRPAVPEHGPGGRSAGRYIPAGVGSQGPDHPRRRRAHRRDRPDPRRCAPHPQRRRLPHGGPPGAAA